MTRRLGGAAYSRETTNGSHSSPEPSQRLVVSSWIFFCNFLYVGLTWHGARPLDRRVASLCHRQQYLVNIRRARCPPGNAKAEERNVILAMEVN